jgi:hypothetical protein
MTHMSVDVGGELTSQHRDGMSVARNSTGTVLYSIASSIDKNTSVLNE